MDPATTPQAPQGAAPSAPNGKGDVSRESIVAELEAIEAPGESPTTTDAPAKPDADKPAAEAVKDDEPSADEPEDTEPAAAAADESPPDPKIAKNIEAIQRAEKRAKDSLAKERQEFTDQKAAWEKEWTPKAEKAQQFEELRSRAAYDPAAALAALGINVADDGVEIAKAIYAASKEGAAKPGNREAAARSAGERELRAQIAAQAKELAAVKQTMLERDQRESDARQAHAFMASVEKAVSDETPIARNLLANDPEETREAIAELAIRIARDTGEMPEPADVVQEFERRRRTLLTKAGVDLSTVIKTTAAAPTNGEKKAKTLSNTLGSPTKARTEPMTEEELREDILRGWPESPE